MVVGVNSFHILFMGINSNALGFPVEIQKMDHFMKYAASH